MPLAPSRPPRSGHRTSTTAFRRTTAALIGVALAVVFPVVLIAQKGQPEFTQQGLLIHTLRAGPGADGKTGRKAADAIRGRVAKLSNKREVDVIGWDQIVLRLDLAGYPTDSALTLGELRALGRRVRADETVVGEVRRDQRGYHISGQLVLTRNLRLIEPLPAAVGKDLDLAADQFAASVAAARKQLVPHRRCENFLRTGKSAEAVAAARDALTAYPPGILARTCLMLALRANGASANQVLEVSREVLNADPVNPYALESAAVALDTLRQRDAAADHWLKLAATDTTNLQLVEQVSAALIADGNPRKAITLLAHATEANPDTIRLVRQYWRALVDVKSWAEAVKVAEHLIVIDKEASEDSSFVLRLAGVYRSNNQPLKAVEVAAHGVTQFPGDVRLYSFYAQLVRGESDVVLPRGLELFPKSAELHAMSARELKSKGKLEESLAASRQAVTLDSALSQGHLMVAQAEVDLGRLDSALVSIRRAVAAGEDSTLVAQFALSKGNSLLRAANSTKRRDDFQAAMRFLAVADTLRPSTQTKFLLGASAFSVTQSALTEAPKVTPKERSCELSRLGQETLPIARASLEAGAEIQPDATKQYLAYLDQLEPFVERQIAAFCT